MLSGVLLLTACGGASHAPSRTAKSETALETTSEAALESPETVSGISEAASGTAVTFTDDLGRTVTADRPGRVACLIASFADIWCLAGGAEQIAAATNATWTYFDLPLREDVVNLGAAKELNLEELIACNPDFVLASCGTDRNRELESAFDDMGLNVAYFQVDTFED